MESLEYNIRFLQLKALIFFNTNLFEKEIILNQGLIRFICLFHQTVLKIKQMSGLWVFDHFLSSDCTFIDLNIDTKLRRKLNIAKDVLELGLVKGFVRIITDSQNFFPIFMKIDWKITLNACSHWKSRNCVTNCRFCVLA